LRMKQYIVGIKALISISNNLYTQVCPEHRLELTVVESNFKLRNTQDKLPFISFLF